MKHSLTSIALGALLLSQSVLAGLYSSKDHVVEVNNQNFQSEVMDSNHLVMVEFYAPWCGHCKNLAPHYKAAAKNLHGIVKMAAIDCDDDKNRPVCSQYDIKGFPTIKVFPANRTGKKSIKRPSDYQGERSAKAIVDHLVRLIPDDIKRVSSNPSSSGVTNINEFVADESESRALLFTKKMTSSNMYKGLATDMKDKMIVAEMRAPTDDILKQFNLENLPTLVVFPKGSQEPVKYNGELKREPISEFFGEYAAVSKSSSTPKPAVVEFDPNVNQIVDQAQFKKECLDKAAGSCVIAFLVVEPEFPESVQMHEENLATLRQVKKAAHDSGKALHVIWMDALDKRVVDFMNNFQLSSDIPGLLLLSPGKKAFAPFVGRFDVEGIQEWVSDSSFGRGRVFPYSFSVVLPEPEAKKTNAKDEL
ncbi:protein disulfide isomerase (PDI) protein [Dissophora globulifera]|uniref:protein disulfide-isomerase n=1 Tax=Dissophora globulifera TaxID=979702 RepID=A0A9P6RVI9_9FUNG|nr:protein disulfide isomerase (PDI) protein [Dissophora globulifera]